MRRDALAEGNVVSVKLDACRHDFEARVTGFDGGDVLIDPIPSWPTWRRVKLTDVAERLEPPMRRRRRKAVAA